MSWQTFKEYADARSFFREIPRTIRRMNEARLVIMYGLEVYASSGQGGTNKDPTASAAIHLADHESEAVSKARATVEECEETIGTALAVVGAVSRGLGNKYAIVLDLHYVDCLTESETAKTMGISKASVKRMISVSCDWCDMMGARLFD